MILITGANGFLGYYLTELLLANNMEVLATGKGECRLPFRSPIFRYESLDFTNREAVARLLSRETPHTIVHCGAMSKPDECEQQREAAFRTNVTGTINLLEEADPNKTFFIFLSTDFVFDGVKGMYKEDDQRNPVNYYGETKVMAEDEVARFKGDWAIVRTVLVYGRPVLNRPNLVSSSAQNLRDGKTLKIFDDQLRTPTYVKDLATGILSIIQQKATGTWHLSGEDKRSPYEIVCEVADFINAPRDLVQPVKEADFEQPARRPSITGFNLDKARGTLNYQPISFEEGLQETLTTS